MDKIDESEVINAAYSISSNKTPGPDGVPGVAVKLIVKNRPGMRTSVHNRCLIQGIFPIFWMQATLVLLRKCHKPLEDPNSYRPLCMLDSLGKLFKKIVDGRLKNLIEKRKFLASN